MEQTFQKQTARLHRYLLRCMSGVAGETSCVICCGHKLRPFTDEDIRAVVHCVQEHNATLLLCYYVPQSLTHYGKVDSLAPAGAMEEFVDYVQELEREEAEEFFRPLLLAVGTPRQGIRILHEWPAWEHMTHDIMKRFAHCLIFEPMDV